METSPETSLHSTASLCGQRKKKRKKQREEKIQDHRTERAAQQKAFNDKIIGR